MSPEERKIKYDQQTESLYAGIGEFVVAFEMLVHAMRNSLVLLLSHGSALGPLAVQPAFADMTAAPLKSAYLASFSVAIRQCGLDEAEKSLGQKILLDVCKRIQAMTVSRNEIVHGTWFIGWASDTDTDFSVAQGFKPKNSKTGTKHEVISRTREDFNVLTDDCKTLAELADRINLLLFSGKNFSKIFVFDGELACVEPTSRKAIPRTSLSK